MKYKPCRIQQPEPYLGVVNYCCKEFHATYSRVMAFVTDERLG